MTIPAGRRELHPPSGRPVEPEGEARCPARFPFAAARLTCSTVHLAKKSAESKIIFVFGSKVALGKNRLRR
jgi:hypothetical protein